MTHIQQLIADHLDLWTSAEIEKKSGRGRSSGNGDTVYGIKKLRELILELAVRGKLVPQDPNDEPASELLKRIQAEKSTKKISTESKLTSNVGDEVNYPLPVGWECVRFGAISEIERGGSPRPIKDYITEDPDGLNWIKIGDTDQGGKYITSANEKIRKEGLSKTRMVYPGDFLLTNSMSFGRPYITKIQGCIHDGWLRISPPDSLDKDYLYCLLSSPYAYKNFKEAAAGAVVFNLNADKVRELPILLPPLPEQHRIVAKVDELMALCDQLETQHNNATDAHEKLVTHLLGTLTQSQNADDFVANWQRIAEHFDTLFTTEHSIDTLKQTLLQLAVMGKLVPQDPNDEPASELLKRIQAEKAKLIASGKIKKEKPLPPISDEEKPFELPHGWLWARGDDAAGFIDPHPSHRTPPEVSGGIPYVGYSDISFEVGINFKNARKVSPKVFEEHRDRYTLKKGDFVFGKIGTIGKPFFLPEPFDYCLSANLILIQPNLEIVNPAFLATFIDSPSFLAVLDRDKTNSTHAVFGIKKARLILVPLPPLAEQHRIVTKVGELASICDHLKSRITESSQLKQKLADALVTQALTA